MPITTAAEAHATVRGLVLKAGHLIDGELVEGTVPAAVTAPWDHSLCIEYNQLTVDDVARSVTAARSAFRKLRNTGGEPKEWLLTIADRLDAEQENFVALICFESGKLQPAARAEAAGAGFSLRHWAAMELAEDIIDASPAHETRVVRSPLGVVAAITPFNMPLLMMVNKIGAALVAGNTIVCKPSPHTPLTAMHFARLVADLVPPGVINIVCGGDNAGPALTSSDGVDMITFTGSIGVGKAIMASAAGTLKRVQLELGGNDPAIVFGDVDLDDAVPKIFQAAFGSSGQACVAVKRVYAHQSIYAEVVRRLAELARAATPGTPFTDGATMPVLTTRAQYDLMHQLLEDSRQRGADIAFEGNSTDDGGYFAYPTIVAGLGSGAPLVEEEQFSPILPVVPFVSAEEVVDAANRGRFGLGATVWTEDAATAQHLIEQLETGMVWINGLGRPNPSVPFGGAKESGIGREGGQLGLDAFTEIKSVTLYRKEAGS